jgi:hypothetical protein
LAIISRGRHICTSKKGAAITPLEFFSKSKVDYERDFCCEFGEPVYVESPKVGTYTGSEPRMELAVCVENL